MTREIKVVRQIGRSKAITIPPRLCNALKIDCSTILSMEQVGNSIVMSVVPVPETEVSKK